MTDESTIDKKTIAVSALAILAFVIVGFLVAVFGAPDEPASVLAETPVTTTTVGIDATSSTVSTSTTVAAPIEIDFEPLPGLGFERRRRWVYDPATKELLNVAVFTPDRPELLIAYTEVLPASVLDLGEFDFDPPTDDVTTQDNGTKSFVFEIATAADVPGELRWTVVTDRVLTAAELEALAADRTAAEAEAIKN